MCTSTSLGYQTHLKKQYPNIPIEYTITDDNITLIDGFKNHQYNLIILDYPINDNKLNTIKLFNETLHLAITKDDPLNNQTNITFNQLNGTSILVPSKTGYWSDLCKEKLPESLIIEQENFIAYKTLQANSTLATFRTNLTIPKFKELEDRIYLPIIDKEATLTFYATYHKQDTNFNIIQDNLTNIPWENYRDDD